VTQSRLNAVAVSHVHQDIGLLDGMSGIATEFASRSQTRRALLMFGRSESDFYTRVGLVLECIMKLSTRFVSAVSEFFE